MEAEVMDDKDEEIAALRASVGMLSNRVLELNAQVSVWMKAAQDARGDLTAERREFIEQLTSIKTAKALVKAQRRKMRELLIVGFHLINEHIDSENHLSLDQRNRLRTWETRVGDVLAGGQ